MAWHQDHPYASAFLSPVTAPFRLLARTSLRVAGVAMSPPKALRTAWGAMTKNWKTRLASLGVVGVIGGVIAATVLAPVALAAAVTGVAAFAGGIIAATGAVGFVAAHAAPIIVGAVLAKGAYNALNTYFNGARYNPFSLEGRTELNQRESAANGRANIGRLLAGKLPVSAATRNAQQPQQQQMQQMQPQQAQQQVQQQQMQQQQAQQPAHPLLAGHEKQVENMYTIHKMELRHMREQHTLQGTPIAQQNQELAGLWQKHKGEYQTLLGKQKQDYIDYSKQQSSPGQLNVQAQVPTPQLMQPRPAATTSNANAAASPAAQPTNTSTANNKAGKSSWIHSLTPK